jgi:parallel beta-helix repeat protein
MPKLCNRYSKGIRHFARLLISMLLGIAITCVLAQAVAASSVDSDIEPTIQAMTTIVSIYVNPTSGNDANMGTIDRPYGTLQKALQIVQPGDTIKLASGVYQESNKTLTSGTASAPIIIEPDDGAKPILDGNLNTLNAIQILNSFYTIRNLEIRNAKIGVQIEGATGVVFENNNINHISFAGLRLRSSAQGNVIRNNVIWATGLAGNFNAEGIYIGTAPEHRYMNGGLPDPCTHNTITGNEIYNVGEGIDIKEDSSFNTITGNIIHDCSDPLSGGINVRSDNNYFYDNTSYNNAGAGFRFGGDITYSPDYGNNYHYGVANILRNNIARNNANAGYKFMNGAQDADISNNGSGNGSPLYVYGAGVKPFIAGH